MSTRIDPISSTIEQTLPQISTSYCQIQSNLNQSASTLSSLQTEEDCCIPWRCILRAIQSCFRSVFQFLCCFEDHAEILTNAEIAISAAPTQLQPLLATGQTHIERYLNNATMPRSKTAIIFRENGRSIFFLLREISPDSFAAFQREAMESFQQTLRNQAAPNWNRIGITTILTEHRNDGDYASIIWSDQVNSGTIHGGQLGIMYGNCACVACADSNETNRLAIREFFQNTSNTRTVV